VRQRNLIAWDMRFQFKYGFYFIYVVLSILYILLLSAFPESWREKAAAILIFSDPAAMGLFFMGAIVLLEKSQGVLNAVAVSPVKTSEYIISKVVSLCIITEIVALVLALAAGGEHLLLTLVGTALTSIIFTLIGIIAGTKVKSLNQFIFIIIPIEIVCFIPPIFYIFGSGQGIWYYPFNALISMVDGKSDNLIIGGLLVLILIALLDVWAYKNTEHMFKKIGGAKL